MPMEKQSAHTPWRVLPGRGYGQLNGATVQDNRGLCIAVAIGDVPELDPDGLARLIAAAPDLDSAAGLAITALAFAEETYQRAGDTIALAQTRAAKNALIAAQDKVRGRDTHPMKDVTPSSPDRETGSKLVPVKPTMEMLNAAIDVDSFKLGDISPLGFRISPQQLFERCWSAMLAAAPEPIADRETGTVERLVAEIASLKLSQSAWEDSARINKARADEAEAHDCRKLCGMGVGDGSGKLFVYGDYDSIKAAQSIVLRADADRAKLATAREALKEARLQITYLHEKFTETGSGNSVLAQIDAAIRSITEGADHERS